MKTFRLEVATRGREVYEVTAESADDARMLFERGKLLVTEVSEVLDAEVVEVTEITQ